MNRLCIPREPVLRYGEELPAQMHITIARQAVDLIDSGAALFLKPTDLARIATVHVGAARVKLRVASYVG